VGRFRGPKGAVRSVALAPDGRRLAAADAVGGVWAWDLETERAVSCKGHKGEVRTVAFAPDGNRLLSGGRDGTLRLWDARTGKQLRRLERPKHDPIEGGIECVVISPDRKLVLAGKGQTLSVWDLDGGTPLISLGRHGGRIDRVALVPGGRVA